MLFQSAPLCVGESHNDGVSGDIAVKKLLQWVVRSTAKTKKQIVTGSTKHGSHLEVLLVLLNGGG